MSIFQLRDKWTTRVGDNEEFDAASIWVGNVDNAMPATDKIVVGSFNGFLRVYAPALRAFRVDDLLLERNMQAAIYQVVGIGSGLSMATGGEAIQLAVLHSRRLLVFTVVTEKAGASLKLAYEIPLKRNAFNFCAGRFGGATKELLCIQSVDGSLQFNDANSVLFNVGLPDFILPGCLCYNSYTDSIIIANGSLELEVYKYSSLGAFANSSKAETKKLAPENAVVVGETVLELRYLRSPSQDGRGGELLVLTLQHVLCYDDNCFILSQHRLDYTPTCMQVYAYFEKGTHTGAAVGSNSELLEKWTLMGSASRHLLVYKGVSTEWASQWSHVPIYVNTLSIEACKGLIVVLSDKGDLSVTYLGTQPSSHMLSLGQVKAISFEKVESETARLRGMIDKYEREVPQKAGIREGGKSVLGTKLQIVSCGETSEYVDDPEAVLARGLNGGYLKLSCRLILSIGATSERLLKNVSVQIVPPKGVKAEQSYLSFPTMKAETPLIVPISFMAENNTFPTSRKLLIYSSYQVTGTTASRVGCEEFDLPLSFFVVPVQSPKQLKEAVHKATLIVKAKDKVPTLATVFKDVCEASTQYGEIVSGNPAVAVFKYHNGSEFGVLLGKSGGKYRVQCARFEGLWFALDLLLHRLSSIGDCILIPLTLLVVEIRCEDSLPIAEIHRAMDEYDQAKDRMHAQELDLEKLSGLYRAIQKRLLLRFKDKNPAPLNNLDLLLSTTYQKVLALASDIDRSQKDFATTCFRLALSIQTLLLLTKIQSKCDEETYEAVRGYLGLEQMYCCEYKSVETKSGARKRTVRPSR